ncbi:MAG: endolytic transglycosylase MltG [Nitrospirota bacterium]
MVKRLIRLTAICISIIFLFLFVKLYSFCNTYPAEEESHKIINISEGTGLRKAANILFKEGLITDSDLFVLWGKIKGIERRLIPGEYDLHSRMLPTEILNMLNSGRVLQYKVTIPEGVTAKWIGKRLEEKGLADHKRFLRLIYDREFIKTLKVDADSLEGYLFPDTYFFSRNTKEEEVIKRMVAQFREIYTKRYRERERELNMTQNDIVTLASIIQKEMGTDKEAALISAVFHNRLKKKMALQSDPTVIYALPEFNGNLRRVDLKINSPYNTYRKKGLPPGAISNPGKKAIHAALYPADVNYLYFVSKNNGTHKFSRTISEHNIAVWKYQKVYYRSARRRIKDIQQH